MSGERFIEHLGGLDRKARATLRRSLAFPPGTYAPAFPYAEPFAAHLPSRWDREMYYLTAGLFASHEPDLARTDPALNLGISIARLYRSRQSGQESLERRFIILLDSDEDQLANRLRHMIALLNEVPINWTLLLTHLARWRSDNRWVQQEWARAFYRNQHAPAGAEASEATLEQAVQARR